MEYQELPLNDETPNQDGQRIQFDIKNSAELQSENFSGYITNPNPNVKFFEQATQMQDLPSQPKVLKSSISEVNDSVFAVFSRNTTQWSKFELLEFMGLEDYKILSKSRIRIYVSIIKELFRTYKGHVEETIYFLEFRNKLFQIQHLIKYLGIENDYEKFYGGLRECNFSIIDDLQDFDEIKPLNQSHVIAELVNQNNEEETNEQKRPQTSTEESFYLSKLQHYSSTGMRDELLKEEKKWVKRIDWLEQKLLQLNSDSSMEEHLQYITSKMQSLSNLDIKITSAKKNKSPDVFFLAEFLDNLLKEEEYSPLTRQNAQIGIEKEFIYPQIEQKIGEDVNTGYPILKCWTEIREKLCFSIQNREQQTDYFLTVFQRKLFGNEKVYEKRINIRNRNAYIRELTFSPCGNYLLCSLTVNWDTNISLIFEINQLTKSPLLVKLGTEAFGFFNDKFYSWKYDNTTLYEHDLQNQREIIAHKLEHLKDGNRENIYITKKGICYINQVTEQDLTSDQDLIKFEVYFNNTKCNLEQSENLHAQNEPQLFVNKEGDTFLLKYRSVAEEKYKFQLFEEEQEDMRQLSQSFIKDLSNSEQPRSFSKGSSLNHMQNKQLEQENFKECAIVPLYKSFLIIYKKRDSLFFLENNNFVCRVERFQSYQIQDLKLRFDQKGSLKEFRKEMEVDQTIKYQKWVITDSIKDEANICNQTDISFPIYNNEQCLCFPYFYFIHNNDQVFMKDMSKPQNKGFYYMNSFLGIEKGNRPLTIWSTVCNDKIMMNVPSIQSDYKDKGFTLKVHSIKSKNQQTERLRFQGMVRYRIYAFNEGIMQVMQKWMITFMEQKPGSLIKIVSKSNCFSIEKWESEKCKSRIIISYFSLPRDPQLDITQQEANLYTKNFDQWFFVLQDEGVISLFSKNIRYNFKQTSFLEMEPIFKYKIDEKQDDVYDILIDNTQEKQLDFYIINSNYSMKRFTTKLLYGQQVESFEEDLLLYSCESYIRETVQQSSLASGPVRKLTLWESKIKLFIANKILYSPQFVIDYNITNPSDKIQKGFEIQKFFKNLPSSSSTTQGFSGHECKAFASSLSYSDTLIVIIYPLLNARKLPLFHSNQFTHPVVPMVNDKLGYSQVFTLNVESRQLYSQESTHAQQKKRQYQFLKLISPGLIVKHFNGLEQRFLLSDYGYEFDSILRFKQSLTGQYLTIVGTKKEKSEGKKVLKQGVFLFKLGFGYIELLNEFLFAEKNPNAIDEEILMKMRSRDDIKKEYVEPEINGHQLLEYQQIYQQMSSSLEGYNNEIEYQKYDEESYKERKLEDFKSTNKQFQKGRTLNKSQLNNDIDMNKFEEQLIEDNEYNEIVKIKDLKENYPRFNIPILEDKMYDTKNFEFEENKILLIKEENLKSENQEDDNENKDEFDGIQTFSEREREKISLIHFNYHLLINDEGDLFLIERFYNKLYYFHFSELLGKYRLFVKKFDPDFRIMDVDSSQEYLIVNSDSRFQAFKINRNHDDQIKPSPFLIDYNQNDPNLLIDSNQIEEEFWNKELHGDYSKNLSDQRNKLNLKYIFKIEDCKIRDDNIIIRRIDSNSIGIFTVYNINSKIITNFYEDSKILISGNKQYIWQVERNQVFDIKNGLQTFFLWSSNIVATSSFFSFDLFNVNNQKSIMTTQGYLVLAFDYISTLADKSNQEKNDDFVQQVGLSKYFPYIFYNIGKNMCYLKAGTPNTLSTEIEEEEEQPNNDENGEDVKPIRRQDDIISEQESKISRALNFFNESIIIDASNEQLIANFFLTYFFIKKDEKTGESECLNIFQTMFQSNKPRQIVIDDLFRIISVADNPIVENVINTCFSRFLETSYQSAVFQNYLEGLMKQTNQMKDMKNFQIKLNETGIHVSTFNSPIIDNNFNAKFEDPKEVKKDVEIYYIHMGEILNKQGMDIMDVLSNSDYTFMMSIPIIQHMVMYQWIQVKNTIQERLLIPFFLLLGFYFCYATFQIDWYKDQKEAEINALSEIVSRTLNDASATQEQIAQAQEIEANLKQIQEEASNFTTLWILNVIGLLGILFYLYMMETKQFLKDPSKYFTEFWNIADLVNYTLCLCVIMLDIFDAPVNIMRPIAAICVIILWIKLFYFLRLFDTTARLVRMIIEIVNDMKNFMIVLGIGVVGFANGLYLLSQNQKDGIAPFAGQNFIEALIYTYRLALGDFSTDDFYNLHAIDVIIVWSIFIIATLFVVIVLLNLLIAIMGDTFSRVLENITNLTIREKVLLISENEAFFDREAIFKAAQYLIIIKEKNIESAKVETWDGQMNSMRRQMVDKLNTLQVNLDSKITSNSNETKALIEELNEKTKKSLVSLEQKMAGIGSAVEVMIEKVSGSFETMTQRIAELQLTNLELKGQLEKLQAQQQKA